MKWDALVKVYDVDTRTGRILANCPKCGKGTFVIINGIGRCISCGFKGTQETVYRLLTGSSRETTEAIFRSATEAQIRDSIGKLKNGRRMF